MLADLDLKTGRPPLCILLSNNRDCSAKWGSPLSTSTVTVSFPRATPAAERRFSCLSPPPAPLPASICPIRATEATTRLPPSWFHSGDPSSWPLEGMMDWFETKPSPSQTERFPFYVGEQLETTGENHVPIMYKLFTTR